MARPTKYNPELLDRAYDYLINYETHGDVMPSHLGLFLHLDISKTCGYDWGNEPKKKEFSDILDKCMALQHQKLFNAGLDGTFNAAITKLALGKHGYSDKTENEHTGKDGGAIQVSKVVFNPVGSE